MMRRKKKKKRRRMKMKKIDLFLNGFFNISINNLFIIYIIEK
jgi:hypothetical protein